MHLFIFLPLKLIYKSFGRNFKLYYISYYMFYIYYIIILCYVIFLWLIKVKILPEQQAGTFS